MKLELKHLAGYLPYNLEIQHKLNKAKHRGEMKLRPWVSTLEPLKLQCINKFFDWKPIMRPLSDYSKFNEIVLKMTNYEIEMIDENPDLVGRLSHDVIELMFKNHIDIHGLIPAGLAIDINTLNKQL